MDYCIASIIAVVLVIIGILIWKSYYNEMFVDHIGETCATYAHKLCASSGLHPSNPAYHQCIKENVNKCHKAKGVK